MTRFFIAFVCGVLCLHATPALPSPPARVMSAVVALACVRASPVLSAAIAGFLLATSAASGFLAERWPTVRHGETIVVDGTVVSLVEQNSGRGQRFMFQSDPIHAVPQRIRVGWYLDVPPPRAGERWRLALRLQTPRGLL
jgi:competence protein ComEC